MLLKFQNHLSSSFPFLKGKKLLLAVSGGIDSMVLVHLFQQLNYHIVIAHCNFQLRGEESDADEVFVKTICKQFKVPFHGIKFDTKTSAEEQKKSIQVTARNLRYDWFSKLLEENEIDFLLTAHQLDDSLETFIINLSRGTGLDGLTGIPMQNENIIRPLLYFSREEVVAYAKENNIQWREDSSNASDTYLRNKIRHDIVPILKELNPSFLISFQNTLDNLQQAQSLVDDASRIVYRKVVEDVHLQKKINLTELKQLSNYRAYLYQWLQPFGFTAWNDIYDLVEATSGKQIFSTDYVLLKDRTDLIVFPKNKEVETTSYWIEKGEKEVKFPLNISFCKSTYISHQLSNTIFVDGDKLTYPLEIRKWEQGDFFYPFGMSGKSKKVSKLFKDEKLSLIEKENIWILCSDNQIVWLIGIRQDERFRINDVTKNIIQIKV
jgi:tRNA(Ile)-lysidine synthase